jgi:hypothetical protein
VRSRILVLCAITVLVVIAAACSSDKNASNSTGSTAATFKLSEWRITLDGSIPSGQVDVKIDNQGSETHELVIVAAKDAAALPTKADGSVDEDKIPEADKVGESGDVPAGKSVTESFTFVPGEYIAFCNIVDSMGGGNTMGGGNMMGGGSGMSSMGHVHFALGMYTTFTVG